MLPLIWDKANIYNGTQPVQFDSYYAKPQLENEANYYQCSWCQRFNCLAFDKATLI